MNRQSVLRMAAWAAVLSLGACGQRAADAPARDHSEVALPTSISQPPQAANDPRDAPVPRVDGKPLWSANRRSTAEENARSHFERNGEAFGAKDLDDFVAKAHAFVANPPAGTERIKRASNGDTLLYDPRGNVFAVVTKDGAPRTMFKPDNGATYWETQKAKESAAAKRGGDREG